MRAHRAPAADIASSISAVRLNLYTEKPQLATKFDRVERKDLG